MKKNSKKVYDTDTVAQLIYLSPKDWERVKRSFKRMKLSFPQHPFDIKRFSNSSRVARKISFESIIKNKSDYALLRLAHMILNKIGLDISLIEDSIQLKILDQPNTEVIYGYFNNSPKKKLTEALKNEGVEVEE